jgi:hypothetical protein
VVTECVHRLPLCVRVTQGKKRHGDPKSTSWSNCRKLSSKLAAGLPPGTSCVFGLSSPNAQVPANAGLYLVVEVRLSDESTKSSESGGWGFLPAFQPGGGPTLNRGFHKMQLLTGTFSPTALEMVVKGGAAATPGQQARRPTPNGSLLYVRVVGADDTLQDVPLDDPVAVADIYLTPRARSTAAPVARDNRDDKMESPRPVAERAGPSAGAPQAPSAAAVRLQIPLKASANSSPQRPSIAFSTKKPEAISMEPPTQLDPFTLGNKAPPPPSPGSPTLGPFRPSANRATTPPQQHPAPGLVGAGSTTDSLGLGQGGTGTQERPGSSHSRSSISQSQLGGSTRRGSRRNSLERTNPFLGSSAGGSSGPRSSVLGGGSLFQVRSEGLPPPREADEDMAMAMGEGGEGSRMSSVMEDGKPFVENMVPGGGRGARRKPWEKGDGFNVYVDSARGLPDNVTITRATLRMLTSRNEQVGQDTVGYCKLDQLRAAPDFGIFVEFRGETFDPTSTLLLRLDTVCLRTKKLSCVGYAVLNVFVEGADPTKQPTSSAATDFVLNQGAFQLPLHNGPPQTSGDFSSSSLAGVPRLPCATALLRIHQAVRSPDGSTILTRADVGQEQWQAMGVFVPAPRYGDGVYDTTRCVPTDAERVIYQRRASQGPQGEHKQQVRAVLAAAFPGETPDADTQEWIATKLGGKPAQLLDPTYLLTYQQDLGFKVAVDGLLNLPSPGLLQAPKFYKVVYLLSPPALYYNDPPLTDDTHMTREYVSTSALPPMFPVTLMQFLTMWCDALSTPQDLDSPVTAPLFKDGFTQFRQVPYNSATVRC